MRKLFESLFKSYGVNEEYRPGKIKDVRIAVSVLDIFVTEETAVFNFCKLVFKFFGTHDKQYTTGSTIPIIIAVVRSKITVAAIVTRNFAQAARNFL